ncbi:MAG: VOC family protein [Rhodoglobus sp.]
MEMKLEVLVLPVADVEVAKAFYEQVGFHLDHDIVRSPEFRVVQFTPPGSNTSILVGSGLTDAAPGSVQGLHLVVTDIAATREELVARGISVSEIFHDEDTFFHRAGTAHNVDGPNPRTPDYGTLASFVDPDGNGWFLQQINDR